MKIKLRGSKWRLSRQINDIEQNDITIEVVGQKCDMVSKKRFCQSVPQVTFNNFTLHVYFLKIESSCSKRPLSGKINGIDHK